MISVQTVFDRIPPVDRDEVLRYADCREADDELKKHLKSCISLVTPLIENRVCYSETEVKINGDEIDFGTLSVTSHDLSVFLKDSKKAVIFAATIGIGIDRLIRRTSVTSVTDSLLCQAIGAERIEALCDRFCADYPGTVSPNLRFSPGYGDLPLDFQLRIFNLLDCRRKIGLTLNSSLLMSPSKSVTAIVPLKNID